LKRLAEELEQVGSLGLDSAPLIYLVERHPDFGPLVRQAIEQAEAGSLQLVTSSITLTEVLCFPFEQKAEEVAQAYRDILLNSPYLRLQPVDAETAEQAARLRAAYRLKTPDAIQLAAALQSGCDAFLTNDLSFRRVRELKPLILADLEL
jgi:predicted nucleic acid-binding protein